MQALILQPEQRTAEVRQIPIPTPKATKLLVKVSAVGLNPVDALYTFRPIAKAEDLRVVGSDFAGVVAAVGTDVAKGQWKAGDRVAGFLQGATSVNDRPGAFAEYLTVPSDLVWKVRDNMSLEEAAALSLCALTAAQGLFRKDRLGLTAPWTALENGHVNEKAEAQETKRTLLIYGAATSVGIFAAQLVRLSGLNVTLIGVASPKHHDWLREAPYSYDILLDYRSDWQSEVRRINTGKGLDLAFDCISEGSTVQDLSELMQPQGKLAIVRSKQGGAWKSTKELSVEPKYGAVWQGLGEVVDYGVINFPADPEARLFAVSFYKWLSALGESGLRSRGIRLMPGGLSKIVDDGLVVIGSALVPGHMEARSEKWMRPISAEKLVYRIE